MSVLVTGAAGFIGMHCIDKLLDRGDRVVGIDNLNDYYDVSLKSARLERLRSRENFDFHLVDVSDRDKILALFGTEGFTSVIHLAAQAGVRYSLTNPHVYIDANVLGFTNILEGCRQNGVDHLVYASSSSVYGGNTSVPFSERDSVDHPISLYAATKKANELMAHTYSHLYGLPTTGLRFFTVYGPWGRPDMALFIFAKSILQNETIEIFNNGNMVRDFTFVDDIVEGILRVLDKPATPNLKFDPDNPNPASALAPYRIFNIGNSQPVQLMDYILALEEELGLEAKKVFLPLQPGDVPVTFADTKELHTWVNFKPNTPMKEGVARFVQWFRAFYNV